MTITHVSKLHEDARPERLFIDCRTGVYFVVNAAFTAISLVSVISHVVIFFGSPVEGQGYPAHAKTRELLSPFAVNVILSPTTGTIASLPDCGAVHREVHESMIISL